MWYYYFGPTPKGFGEGLIQVTDSLKNPAIPLQINARALIGASLALIPQSVLGRFYRKIGCFIYLVLSPAPLQDAVYCIEEFLAEARGLISLHRLARASAALT